LKYNLTVVVHVKTVHVKTNSIFLQKTDDSDVRDNARYRTLSESSDEIEHRPRLELAMDKAPYVDDTVTPPVATSPETPGIPRVPKVAELAKAEKTDDDSDAPPENWGSKSRVNTFKFC
jgi:hypothetical protein